MGGAGRSARRPGAGRRTAQAPGSLSREVVGSALAGAGLLWLTLLLALWRARPDRSALRDGLRLLPDVLRLLPRLARDRDLPRGARLRLWLLLGYVALPVDLVPDFVPVVGYADDVVLVLWTLRAVVRRADGDLLARHWPGTPDGLAAVRRLAGLDKNTF